MNLRITSLLSNNETIGDEAIQHFFHHGHSMFRRALQKPPRNDARKSVLRTWVIDQVLEYLLAKLLLLFIHLIRAVHASKSIIRAVASDTPQAFNPRRTAARQNSESEIGQSCPISDGCERLCLNSPVGVNVPTSPSDMRRGYAPLSS